MVKFVEYRPWRHHEEAGRPLAELSLDDTISIAFTGIQQTQRHVDTDNYRIGDFSDEFVESCSDVCAGESPIAQFDTDPASGARVDAEDSSHRFRRTTARAGSCSTPEGFGSTRLRMVSNFTSACCTSRVARGNSQGRTHSETSSNYLCTST
jgi:hypothetical protein